MVNIFLMVAAKSLSLGANGGLKYKLCRGCWKTIKAFNINILLDTKCIKLQGDLQTISKCLALTNLKVSANSTAFVKMRQEKSGYCRKSQCCLSAASFTDFRQKPDFLAFWRKRRLFLFTFCSWRQKVKAVRLEHK